MLELLFPTVKDSYGKGNYTTLVTLGGMLELVARDGRVVQFIERKVGGWPWHSPWRRLRVITLINRGEGWGGRILLLIIIGSKRRRHRGCSSDSSSMHGIRTTGDAL